MIKYLLSNKWGVNQVYIVLTRVCTGWNINSFNMDCFNVSCFHFWNETPNRHNKSFKTFIFRNSIVNMFVLISFPNQAFNRYSKFFVIFKLVLYVFFLFTYFSSIYILTVSYCILQINHNSITKKIKVFLLSINFIKRRINFYLTKFDKALGNVSCN